jgi:hypothetical protein
MAFSMLQPQSEGNGSRTNDPLAVTSKTLADAGVLVAPLNGASARMVASTATVWW